MLIVLWCVMCLLAISSSLQGPHVCIKKEKKIIYVQVSTTIQERTVFEDRESCCNGYKEENYDCVPICTSCIIGKCIAPETCQCYLDYSGADCKIPDMKRPCPDGTFGTQCTQQCTCVYGTCSAFDGICTCQDGWKGHNCSQRLCQEGLFGEDCKKSCNCNKETTELCHPWTGECTCKPGWNGTSCLNACPFPTYGLECEEICKCSTDNTAACDHVTGKCVCKPGWKGDLCEVQCQHGETLPSCGIVCDCKHGLCDYIIIENFQTGRCNCSAGWQGKNCDLPCDEGFYGQDCKSNCSLTNRNIPCHHETGEPICNIGYAGKSCDQCQFGKYGTDCINNCSCTNNSTCDHITGKCDCNTGWIGENCELKCLTGSYGYNCSQSCKCPNCRHTDGYCECQQDFTSHICTDYCPDQFYDLERKICVDPGSRNVSALSIYPVMKLLLILLITMLTIILPVASFVYYKCVYLKMERADTKPLPEEDEDGYLVPNGGRPPGKEHIEIKDLSEPIYAEIDETNIVSGQYNKLQHEGIHDTKQMSR